MNRFDLFFMAVQNLWARKSRTAFNIFGIVVSCSLLLLTFAGTRGARDGLMNLFADSDFSKQFAIRPGRDFSVEPHQPDKKHEEMGTGIADDRRERIREKLTDAWTVKNYPKTRITLDKLNELRKTPGLVSVLPNRSLRTQMTIGEQKFIGIASCFSSQSCDLPGRVVAGVAPESESSQGKIWIDEYRAWRLGFKTDQQLDDLVGQTVSLRFQVATAKLSPGIRRFASAFGISGIDHTEQLANTFRKLFADLDQTRLDDDEKETIRMAAEKLGLDSDVSEIASSDAGEPFIFRDFEVAGIVRPAPKTDADIFNRARANSGKDLLIDWRDYQEIEKATQPNRVYYYCIGSVESSDDLRETLTKVESAGMETISALEILERADEELRKVRLIVASIAFVILLIASVGIMNTVIIAVMERTPEFGIMKAVGATDKDIRWLMLIEAALTGILGAIVSLGIAFLIDSIVSQYARRYIETQIRQDFNFSIFVYSWVDMLLICSIAIGICMLASLLPSRRAAKLDPIIAMK